MVEVNLDKHQWNFKKQTLPGMADESEASLKRALLSGGQDEVDEEPPIKAKKIVVESENLTEGDKIIIESIKNPPYDKDTKSTYFAIDNHVYALGISSKYYLRLGFDAETELWKVFIKKLNHRGNPSYIHWLYEETPEIITELKAVYLEADMCNGKKWWPFPTIPLNYKAPDPDSEGFWNKDVWYSSSGELRMRPVVQRGMYIYLYINLPRVYTNPDFTGNGPRTILIRPQIRLLKPEIKQLYQNLEKIQTIYPPIEKLKSVG